MLVIQPRVSACNTVAKSGLVPSDPTRWSADLLTCVPAMHLNFWRAKIYKIVDERKQVANSDYVDRTNLICPQLHVIAPICNCLPVVGTKELC
jgi:hypothetical protein